MSYDDFQVCVCVTCGIRYGIEREYYAILSEHRGGRKLKGGDDKEATYGWYTCPNGHPQRKIVTRADELGRKNVELSKKLELAEARAQTAERKLTRKKTRRARPAVRTVVKARSTRTGLQAAPERGAQ